MNIRKIAVIGGFAAGVGLALAPIASADIGDGDGGAGALSALSDFQSNVLNPEIVSMNSMFHTDALFGGVSAADYASGTGIFTDGGGAFDTMTGDLSTYDAFSNLVYGLDPSNVPSGVAGGTVDAASYGIYNGATVQFDDAWNVLVYSALNNGDVISAADASDYLMGSTAGIAAGLDPGTWWGDAGAFFTAGLTDMAGYFGL